MRKKGWLTVAVLLIAILAVGGCGKTAMTPLSFSTGVNAAGNYDSSLFYRNDMTLSDTPDPGAFYEDGYFYMYPTGAPIRCFRTKNFADYEYLGYAFTPSDDSWAYWHFWAPEVIKIDGKYYMYYTAAHKNGVAGHPSGTNEELPYGDRFLMGVAVSDKPEGPFVEWTGTRTVFERDEQGNKTGFMVEETVEVGTPTFDFRQGPVAYAFLGGGDISKKKFPVIDAHPFLDDDGQLYLYFASEGSLWGVKMINPVTPDYDTLSQLTEAVKDVVGGEVISTEVSAVHGHNWINEAPTVVKHTSTAKDGAKVTKYYLTFSIWGYTFREYAVCTAVADSPLGYAVGSKQAPKGGYVKLQAKYGQPMHGGNLDADFVSGTGHHSFAKAGEDMFIIYHGHKDREGVQPQRAIAADRVYWVYNDELGYDILHSNGPTYSLQPIPAVNAAYKNIVADATVTATDGMEGYDPEVLKDGVVAIQGHTAANEFRVSGETTITVEFAAPREIRAVMLYNSCDYDLAFSKIDRIEFDQTYFINDLLFPTEYVNADSGVMRQGGAAVAMFDAITVKKITFRISQKLSATSNTDWAGIALSDIVVLGK